MFINMIAVVLLVVVFVQGVISQNYYVTPSNVNIDEIIKNDRLTRNYLDCILEKGRCTPEGEKLKKVIPDALQNECAKCNDKQKEGIRKVILHLIKNKPNWWQEVQAKFDPKDVYKKKYKELLEKEGIKL